MNKNDAVTTLSMAPPPNFPVTWEQPDEANLYWELDCMHWPTPVTPLTGQYIDIFVLCANPVLAAIEFPARMRSRRINTYHYHATAPLPLAEQEMAAQMRRHEAKLDEALRHLDERWTTTWLPEIKDRLAYWQHFDLAAAALPALVAHLDATLEHIKRLAEIHHWVQQLAELAPSLFQDLYSDLFSGDAVATSHSEKPFEAYRLLQGFDNKTLATTRSLWQLSRQALATLPVRQVLQTHAATSVLPALEKSPEGQHFLAELRTYLATYGQRSAKVLNFDAPTWLEEPTPIIRLLQGYITQPERDIDGALAAQAATRERLVAETRLRLHAYPQPVVDQFEILLKAAQVGVFLSEEHSYWIDYSMTHQVRQVMLEFGRRFAQADVFDTVDDIFYLTLAEVRATAKAVPHPDQRRVVAGRQAEMAYFRTIKPPLALGRLPSGPSPDDPLSRAERRFWGAPPPSADKSAVLYGTAASQGVVRGRAKVVTTLAEAGKVQKGDVLVAQSTQPAWTPLFAIAAAVVTDTGGVLCHAAVVAREYGIPAVVGVGMATPTLRDGQLVEVDGKAGVVRIIA